MKKLLGRDGAMRKLIILAVLAVGLVTLLGSDGAQPASAQVPGWNFDDSGSIKFIDISTTGTELTDLKNCDDCQTGIDPAIGFTFSFKGTDYTEVEPTTNGVINMVTINANELSNEAIPSKANTVGDASLFPFWDDLDGSDGSGSPDARIYAQTLGTAPNRVFIVQWDKFPHNANASPPDFRITFQAALCEKGNIVFQYPDAVFGDPGDPDNTDNGGSASVGIQWSGQTGLQYSLNSAVINNGLAIVFFPNGGSADNCIVALNAPVGGLAVDLDGDLGDLPLETASSGGNVGLLAGLIAGISAVAITVTGAAWYARRRLISH